MVRPIWTIIALGPSAVLGGCFVALAIARVFFFGVYESAVIVAVNLQSTYDGGGR